MARRRDNLTIEDRIEEKRYLDEIEEHWQYSPYQFESEDEWDRYNPDCDGVSSDEDEDESDPKETESVSENTKEDEDEDEDEDESDPTESGSEDTKEDDEEEKKVSYYQELVTLQKIEDYERNTLDREMQASKEERREIIKKKQARRKAIQEICSKRKKIEENLLQILLKQKK